MASVPKLEEIRMYEVDGRTTRAETQSRGSNGADVRIHASDDRVFDTSPV
jgi:hypothetical protein